MSAKEMFDSCGIKTDKIILKEDNCEITINLKNDQIDEFIGLLDRLEYDENACSNYAIDRMSQERLNIKCNKAMYDILVSAINKGEHNIYKYEHNPYYDIKLGYSCNNNCIHCVVRHNLLRIKERNPDSIVLDADYGMWCKDDLKFDDVVQQFNTLTFKNAKVVTLTGGEPTLRKDFIDILKWVYYNRPDMKINLQTNGRALQNIELVKRIKRYSRNFHFVVSFHSFDEQIHNEIVNNRKDIGNPFQETKEGLKNLFEVFTDAAYKIRMEIVLSNRNYKTLLPTIEWLHKEFGVKFIGFSYPDLQNYDQDKVCEIAPLYKDLGEILNAINNYNIKNRDLHITYEDIPQCIMKHFIKGEVCLRDIHLGRDMNQNITINSIGESSEFAQNSRCKIHLDCCNYCEYRERCAGLWIETSQINSEFIGQVVNKKGKGED